MQLDMIGKSMNVVSQSISFRVLGTVIGTLVRLLALASSQSQSNALLDAPLPPDGEPPILDLDGTNWVILRKQLSWGESSAICDLKYFRLARLITKEKAQALIDKIESISVKYSPDYDKKYMEIEFGMDRRYWIGLTDQIEDGRWFWTHDGSRLTYDFWYPNQPDHKKGSANSREHCVTLWNPGFYHNNKHSFNDEDCTRMNYAICDKNEEAPINPDHSAPQQRRQAPDATPPDPPQEQDTTLVR